MTHLNERQEKCLIRCYQTNYADLEVIKTLPDGLISVEDTKKADPKKTIQQHLKVEVSELGHLLAQAIMDRNKARENGAA